MGVIGHLFRPTERIDGVLSQACTARLPACLPFSPRVCNLNEIAPIGVSQAWLHVWIV